MPQYDPDTNTVTIGDSIQDSDWLKYSNPSAVARDRARFAKILQDAENGRIIPEKWEAPCSLTLYPENIKDRYCLYCGWAVQADPDRPGRYRHDKAR